VPEHSIAVGVPARISRRKDTGALASDWAVAEQAIL